MTTERVYTLQALTDIWTGDASRKGERLISTGLLGSIRWWFEVLVRGLGGSACDPTDTQCQDRNHCVVCELFGCTGWARKFRFEVLDENDRPKQTRIKNGETFKLRFTELRPIDPAEWALLDLTLRLIAEYGAIGGKTIYKPSDEAGRKNAAHHGDHGLIKIDNVPEGLPAYGRVELERYVQQNRWRKVDHGHFAWASLAAFWGVNGHYLARQNGNQSSFNRVIGRPEPKKAQAGRDDSWLAGRRAGHGPGPESKKVFSFKSPPRTFGFVNGDTVTFDEIKKRLRNVWPDLNHAEFRSGHEILDELIKEVDRP